jgi:hypothetical protein
LFKIELMGVLLSKMFTLIGRHFGLAPRRRTGRMPLGSRQEPNRRVEPGRRAFIAPILALANED